MIFCIELLVPAWEWRLAGLAGAVFSEFRKLMASNFSSPPSSDFRIKGRFVDSLNALALGSFTASSNSVTELDAISFCRAA